MDRTTNENHRISPVNRGLLQFDILFADVFIKQFGKDQKCHVLNAIFKLMIEEKSKLFIREYFGNIRNILTLWDNRVLFTNLSIDENSEPQLYSFLNLKLNQLKSDYINFGYVYDTISEFYYDLLNCQSNEIIYNDINFKRSFDKVFVIEKLKEN